IKNITTQSTVITAYIVVLFDSFKFLVSLIKSPFRDMPYHWKAIIAKNREDLHQQIVCKISKG
ncbi:hypothetical protein ACVPN1_005551, partial [Klebsiella pneumoniae]